MTLLIKNSYNFVANIFWQIADDKKTIPNFKLIQQSTKHDMLCHIKTKTHSWGFCKKQELLMPQKTASLAKFIINMSNIEKYDNCIVCYKVGYNEADEKRETALEQHINNPKIEAAMQTELYAYVMLLNGTICPDMGECVGDFDTIYSLLVQMAKKYEVEYIYFTFDIASLFFNIFELFNYAKHHDSNMSYAKHKNFVNKNNNTHNTSYKDNKNKLLIKIINNLTQQQRQNLIEFMQQLSLEAQTKFNNIKLSLLSNDFNNHVTSHTEISLDATIDSSSELYLESWLQLITLNEFQIQAKKDNLFSYLITNLVIIPYTSDELYWKSNKFTEKFNQSLMLPIHKRSSYKYNIMLLLATIVLLYILAESYFSDQSLMNNILNFNTIYYNNHNKNNNHNTITSQELTIPKSEAVVPQKLITNCLIQYDLFFSKFNNWTLTSIRCDSLSLEFNFMPNNLNNLNVDNFIQQLKSITTKNINYTDKSNKHYNGKIIFSNNLLKYQDNYNLNYYNHLKTSAKLTKYEVVNQLQQFANQYNFKLNIPHSLGDKVEYKKIKFIIESTQSPFYLMKVHVFDNLLLNNISMHIVENNGFYLWKTQGEI